MNSKKSQSLILAVFVLSIGVVAFRFANAQVANQIPTDDRLQGTFMITIETGTEKTQVKALVDPQVVEIGGRHFLRGAESGDVKDLIKETVFSGQVSFVPLDRIIVFQQIDTK